MLTSRPGVGFIFPLSCLRIYASVMNSEKLIRPALKFLAAKLSSFLFLFRIVSLVSLLNYVAESVLFFPHGFNEFS